jgi:hypothetical protein
MGILWRLVLDGHMGIPYLPLSSLTFNFSLDAIFFSSVLLHLLASTGWLLYICLSSIDDQTILSKLRWKGKVMGLEAWSPGEEEYGWASERERVYLRLGRWGRGT